MAKDNLGSADKKNDLFFYIALALLVVSAFILVLNVSKIMKVTGNVVGTANLTVESKTSINFTTSVINWGSGQVDDGLGNATLNTAAGTVVGGNWTVNSAGLVLENIGNQNVTLDFAVGKSVAALLGGSTPTADRYQWNFSNVESGSCINATGVLLGLFSNTNVSTGVCSVFGFADNRDTLRVDIKLVVPSDSRTGVLGDTITATATAV